MSHSTKTGSVNPVHLEETVWSIVNDGVMGGRSDATVSTGQQGLKFSGHLSLENQGGFASCRHRLAQTPVGAAGIRLSFRGDGRRYQLRLRQDKLSDKVAWSTEFLSEKQWQRKDFLLSEFHPVFRGERVAEAGPVFAGNISQIGILLADGQAGAFRIEVRSLAFFSAGRRS